MTRRYFTTAPTDADLTFTYHLDHPTVPSMRSFKYYNLPLAGVGPQSVPIVYLDDLVDKSELPAIHEEVLACRDLDRYWKQLTLNGVCPKEFNGGVKAIDAILHHLDDKYDPEHAYVEHIKDRKTLSEIKRYFYERFGMKEAWEGIVHLRHYTTFAEKSKPSFWLDYTQHMPKLKRLVESLPFKSLGYALFFKTTANQPVWIHRDSYARRHFSHFINVKLDAKPRPFFLYDCTTGERTYLKSDANVYFFNENDFHGIDPEPESRLTLRVEGVFTDEFQERLGILNQPTFDWSYELPRKFLESGQLFVEDDTDI